MKQRAFTLYLVATGPMYIKSPLPYTKPLHFVYKSKNASANALLLFQKFK